jgi:type I restriction enzyme R subunit
MRPVVANPKVTFAQLAKELAGTANPDDQAIIRDQLQAKVQRKIQGMREEDRQAFADLTGHPLPAWLHQLRTLHPAEGQAWAQTHTFALSWLDRLGPHMEPFVLLDQTPDMVREMAHAYTDGMAPTDYLEGFRQFIQSSLNEVPALLAVAQRPRTLTRRDLKAVKQLLDARGYSEAALRTAYADLTNEDIAAGIMGHIRRAAIGDHLIPYDVRVQKALESLLKASPWTSPQRDWLKRIGKQLLQETVVDREALNQGAFETAGGFERINKVFDGRLEQILGDLQDSVWKSVV